MNARDRKAFEQARINHGRKDNFIFPEEAFAAGARYARREMKRRVEEQMTASVQVCDMCLRQKSCRPQDGDLCNFKLRLKGGK